jgi:hypothetical protein
VFLDICVGPQAGPSFGRSRDSDQLPECVRRHLVEMAIGSIVELAANLDMLLDKL